MEICEMFQTPPSVARYMADIMDKEISGFRMVEVLEPTPGKGNLVEEILKNRFVDQVCAPEDYFTERDELMKKKFDFILMNPPFSAKSCNLENAPEFWKNAKGMTAGYNFLYDAMLMSDNIIALMPWFTIADSDVRMRLFIDFGLISVTLLPRKTFDYARIQTCILHLKKGHTGTTEFKYLRKV